MSLYKHTRDRLQHTRQRPRKRLGQNFLVDSSVLDAIVEAAELSPEDLVLEIGAGTGILTKRLAQQAGKIVAVELDDGLFNILQSVFIDNQKVTLIHGDFLEMDLFTIFGSERGANIKQIKVIGNIPYYITTPIIMKVLENSSFQVILMMVQQEVGTRMVASPGTKHYGALSVAISYRADAEILRYVPAESFYPRPKVDSVLVKLKTRPIPSVNVEDEELFFQIVRSAFQYRRKTLRNALLIAKRAGKLKISIDSIDSAFQSLSIYPERRGETLSFKEFAQLANTLKHPDSTT